MNNIQCQSCGLEFNEFDVQDGICIDCQINEASDEEDRYEDLF